MNEGTLFCKNCGKKNTPPSIESNITNDVLIYSGQANHFLNIESVGGYLFLYSDRLYFKSHSVNIQTHELSVGLNEIRSVGVYNTLGLVPNGLAVYLQNGKTEKFVVYKRSVWQKAFGSLGIANAPANGSGSKTLRNCLICAAVLVITSVPLIIDLNLFNAEKKFSSLTEQKQEALMINLYECLDKHFISDLHTDQELAQRLVFDYSSMSFFLDLSNETLENIGNEIGGDIIEDMTGIIEKWAADNRIDLKDLVRNTNADGKNVFSCYIAHLMSIATEQAYVLKSDMNAIMKRGALQGDLFFFLDEYFIPVFQNDEQLVALLAGGKEEDRGVLKNRIIKEMKPIIEKWATERPDTRVEDWEPEELVYEYIEHLAELDIEKVVVEVDYTWIVGNWDPNEENNDDVRMFYLEFSNDGTFSFGDDCPTEGTYTIKGNTVYLEGRRSCPDCRECESEDYNGTLTINGNSIVGYKKY
jgi:hypothetical protein